MESSGEGELIEGLRWLLNPLESAAALGDRTGWTQEKMLCVLSSLGARAFMVSPLFLYFHFYSPLSPFDGEVRLGEG